MDVISYLRNKSSAATTLSVDVQTESTTMETNGTSGSKSKFVEWLDKFSLARIHERDVQTIENYIFGGTTSMTNVADLAITSIDAIKAYTLGGEPKFILDELQDAKIANTQEKQDITGKLGRKISSLKRNKAVVVSGTNGLVSAGMLEAQSGGAFVTKDSTPVDWTDYLVVKSNTATTEYKAVGTAGAEIAAIYVRKPDGTTGEKYTQASTASAKKFAYDPASKKITFSSSEIEDGTEIIVFYTRNVAGDVLNNSSEKYSEKLKLYVDASAEDKCGNVFHVQFYIPKADFSGDFDLTMGDNQAVHAFEAESLAGGCGASGNLWTYTVFGVNAPDAA